MANSHRFQTTLTIPAATYAAGDFLFDVVSVPTPATAGLPVELGQIFVLDKTDQLATASASNIRGVFFGEVLSAANTIGQGDLIDDLSAADLRKIVAEIPFGLATDWGDFRTASADLSTRKVVVPTRGRNVYFTLVAVAEITVSGEATIELSISWGGTLQRSLAL